MGTLIGTAHYTQRCKSNLPTPTGEIYDRKEVHCCPECLSRWAVTYDLEGVFFISKAKRIYSWYPYTGTVTSHD